LPDSAYGVDGMEFHGRISFLKAGISYATHVTTVSETYAKEITTPTHGCGLDGLLRQRLEAGELSGIINGIDDSWTNPEIDGNPLAMQRWKADHAREVRRRFRLSASSGPIFSIVSRLVHQKGIDLSIQAAESIVRNGGQLVVTGRGEPQIERAVEELAARHKGQVAARIGFDDQEARMIFAGSDFLLMPSRFEPCGLSQMYAQRSGSLPIAYRTGGLADTIEDGRTGFLFSALSRHALGTAVDRAITSFSSRRTIQRMRRQAISKRFDWSASARRYFDLYTSTAVRVAS
jgi:starch synthase